MASHRAPGACVGREGSRGDILTSQSHGHSRARLSPPTPPRIAAILDEADALRSRYRRGAELADVSVDAEVVALLDESSTAPLESLGDLSLIQGGLTINGRREKLELRAPYLRVANVSRGSIDTAEMKSMGVTAAELERVKLLDGDLLIVEGHGNRGEVGRTAMWKGESSGVVHQNHLIRVRMKPGISPTFAAHYLNSSIGRAYFGRVVKTTSGLNTLNIGNVRAFPMRVPSPAIQSEFERKVAAAASLRQRYEEQSTRADALFASLQHSAFRGEL